MSNRSKRFQNQVSQNSMQVVSRSHFSGPLPSPQILAGYDKTCPGVAERIIKMAENQATHRIELEKIVLHSNDKRAQYGQLFAFIITIAAIIGGIVVVINGKDAKSYIFGGILSGGTIVSVVSLFLYGKRENKRERAERRTELIEKRT